MQEPEAGRRIVSKGEYAVVQGKRAGATLGGAFLLLTCIVSAFITLCLSFCFLYVVGALLVELHFGMAFVALCLVRILVIGMLTALFGAGAYYAARLYRTTVQQLDTMNNVVLLTRANTADLPAPDSLVRASQEPAQAQEAVLLRASSGETPAGQERHEEQLLRAATEQN